jgi:hypothetical protein
MSACTFAATDLNLNKSPPAKSWEQGEAARPASTSVAKAISRRRKPYSSSKVHVIEFPARLGLERDGD